ncbi:hypothetical protein CMV_018401 [Castanea mollissima]|uniref:Leucine-rich repeat-containing N-terminal plant-type domain-containing protein n=1 Tax=Castanea mollissima TaxID=60419 RepID=A0A8J4VG75_9ROSI|nr:hypothetical protein CMV_018401 [Castanea mollissima]
MGWPLVKSLLWSLLLFVQIHEHRACIEEERMGLLELKAFLKSHTNYTKPLLPTWVYETKGGCCSWEWVNCSTNTGHVINLTLSSINQWQDDVRGTWFFNLSLLQPFKELRILDLSNNGIAGWLGNEESNGFSNMSKLTQLNLRDNNFDKEILRSLGALPVLKSLDLSFNNMWPLSSKELVYLSNLEVLILQDCGLNGSLPFKDMANFSNLEILDLSGNHFTGSNTPYIGALSSLKAISLSYNRLNGTLNTPEFCALKKLEEIDLAGNDFEGMLPPCLKNLTSLSYLDISHNQFNGNLSSSPIASLTSLEYIDLSYNLFEGLFSFNIFANHSQLKVIQFLSDNNKLDIETENHSWDPLFQLKVLVLPNCNLNRLTGNFPKFLLDQHELEVIDLSHNKLNGSFPIWLLENNTGLQQLYVRNNSFTGEFHLPSDHYMNLRWLDLSDNHFDGKLQENIGKRIPKLEYLNFSQNQFEGLLPSCLNLQYVTHLLLQGNKLTGSLPKAILNSSSLLTLDIKDNHFNGSIPDEIDGLPNLKVLSLSGNHFSGVISKQLCRLKWIGIMDLSNNSFSGTIPYCFNNISFGKLAASDFVYEDGNAFGMSGFSFPYNSLLNKYFQIQGFSLDLHEQVEIEIVTKYRPDLYKGLNLDLMSTLDLSLNKLIGEIPPKLGQLSSLHGLNLSHNQLTGPIPKSISNLTQLESLDLSHNNLSGEIPSTLIDMNSLAIFNVSHNNLSGKLPDFKAQFGTFGKSCYEGNPFLCGPPLEKSCTEIDESPPSPQKSSKTSHEKWYQVDLLVFSTSFSVSYIIFFMGVASVLYINSHWRQQCFNLIEDRIYWCYYFALNTLKRLANHMYH